MKINRGIILLKKDKKALKRNLKRPRKNIIY